MIVMITRSLPSITTFSPLLPIKRLFSLLVKEILSFTILFYFLTGVVPLIVVHHVLIDGLFDLAQLVFHGINLQRLRVDDAAEWNDLSVYSISSA